MIDRLIDLALKNRVLVLACYLGLAAWGWWALGATPIDAIPDLSDNQVIVFTDWSGHSPQEVEDQVTYPLTTNLQGLAGVRVVRSLAWSAPSPRSGSRWSTWSSRTASTCISRGPGCSSA
jgi:copper/silver efflux system protein